VPKQTQAGGAPFIPVYAADLTPALHSYRAYVRTLLARLRPQVAALLRATSAGTLSKARAAWRTAHLTWLELGQDDGAYGAFGKLGARIDATSAGLPGGPSNPDFSGFHRIERDLWRRDDLAAARTDTLTLRSLLTQLSRVRLSSWLPSTTAGLTSFTLRCHEVLEDALRDSLSANDDYGSGTDLASVTADVSATREFLNVFAPVLEPRSPGLVPIARRQLQAVMRAAYATRRQGRWVSVKALSLSQRERVDAAVGAALETLAPASELLALGNAP
jgi:high-affinity iron transporter